ncbi:hypothetical protein [Acinetobacter sp. 18QD2AZ41W]|uniref:hypothetical protein n=1 Tax=Acinetobacter sp. 18QD2AZ41W TaxID=2692137 RepID=UPI00135BB79F|nr:MULTISPECIES: hypothetical protein [Acinetobacter]
MSKDHDLNKASSDARADKLDSWVKTHYKNQREFVEKFGLNQGEISNLIQKKRVLGERKARKLEEQTDIPAMYLDGKDVVVSESKTQSILSKRYDRLIDLCQSLDTLQENKLLSDSDLDDINIVFDNAIRTINEMVARRIKPNQKENAS